MRVKGVQRGQLVNNYLKVNSAISTASSRDLSLNEVKPEISVNADKVSLSSGNEALRLASSKTRSSQPVAITDLTEKDIEEFKRYAPLLVIYHGERYVPVKMNFDGDWNLVNNADNFKRFKDEKISEGYTPRELFKAYSTVYVNKLENVVIDGERYTVYQYWFYWPYNSLIFDWHDHDLEYVQVYVDSSGEVRRVYTSYHLWQRIRDSFAKIAWRRGREGKELDKSVLRTLIRSFPGKVRKISMPSKGEKLQEVFLIDKTHPVVIVEPNTHGMVFKPSQSFLITLLNPRVAFHITPKNFIPMLSSENPDSPFPKGKDSRGLVDGKGYLKHRGFPYNWFIRVKSPLLRKTFWEGAHSVESTTD